MKQRDTILLFLCKNLDQSFLPIVISEKLSIEPYIVRKHLADLLRFSAIKKQSITSNYC